VLKIVCRSAAPSHWNTIAGTMKITEAKMIGITPAMLTLSGRKCFCPP
jgi:hypothetical protein